MPNFQQYRPTLTSAAPLPPIPDTPPPGRRVFAIGEMARDFGVTLRALRFYEAKGMLKPRRRGSTRFYTLSDRERLAATLKGKELGFGLRKIREMLPGAAAPDAALPLSAATIADQLATLEAQHAAIARAIVHLRAHAAAMRRHAIQDVREDAPESSHADVREARRA